MPPTKEIDKDTEIEAIVHDVKPGDHGLFAITVSQELGSDQSITFSCVDPDVWNEGSLPKGGDVVILSDIRQKHDKRRPDGVCFYAKKARFKRPVISQTTT